MSAFPVISDYNDSLFIPVAWTLSEQEIINIFWTNFFGSVRRVDFFTSENGKRSAFVHFHYWFNNCQVSQLWDQVEQCGSYKYWYNDVSFLIIRKMTCKLIPDSDMNIHQLAAKFSEQEVKLTLLENRVEEQEDIIEEQRRCLVDSGILELRMVDEDAEMNEMVDSLVGPRWPDEDDNSMLCVYPEDSD
jgi:hypothetical protein